MAIRTSGSRGTTVLGSLLTSELVGQEARRKAEEHTKRRAEESTSESGSSSEEEEDEYSITLSSDDEVYMGLETPSQSDPVDELEILPFKINRPTTRSTPKRSTARSKQKATRNKPKGPSSNTRKKLRG